MTVGRGLPAAVRADEEESRHEPSPIRREVVRGGAASGLGAALSALVLPVLAGAEAVQMTASGAGVNLKLMPDPEGEPVVPLRESFAFDALYAQCIVEDNPERFAMDTFGMGRVVIEPHQFFMAMHTDSVGIYEIRRNADNSLTATLLGSLACATYAGTASVTVGSREAYRARSLPDRGDRRGTRLRSPTRPLLLHRLFRPEGGRDLRRASG